MKKTTKENKESSWLLSVGAETEDDDFGEKQAVAAAVAGAAEPPDSFHTTSRTWTRHRCNTWGHQEMAGTEQTRSKPD